MSPVALMPDVTRHFHARQHLGRAVVIGDEPAELLGAAYKHWLKLSRILQRRRNLATNAVEILKYTYTITQMQQTRFAAEAPHEESGARLHFVRAEQLQLVPADCLSVYVAGQVAPAAWPGLVAELPASCLVVDYFDQTRAVELGLRPRLELEQAVGAYWRKVEGFLRQYGVDTREFVMAAGRTEALDDAVDVLLEVESEFLGLARRFQHALDLARPLRSTPKAQRDLFEAFMMLAHRVQTLAPGGFSAQFLGTYADDTFFLSDQVWPLEPVAEAIARHRAAGRFNLVRALMRLREPAGPVWVPGALMPAA
jgi:hypothetical protein